MPEDDGDVDFRDRRQGVFADSETVGFKTSNSIRSVDVSFQQAEIAVVMHGDSDLGFELFCDLLGIFWAHRVSSSHWKKHDVYMSYEFKLILIEWLAYITRMTDTEAIHLEDKR